MSGETPLCVPSAREKMERPIEDRSNAKKPQPWLQTVHMHLLHVDLVHSVSVASLQVVLFHVTVVQVPLVQALASAEKTLASAGPSQRQQMHAPFRAGPAISAVLPRWGCRQ